MRRESRRKERTNEGRRGGRAGGRAGGAEVTVPTPVQKSTERKQTTRGHIRFHHKCHPPHPTPSLLTFGPEKIQRDAIHEEMGEGLMTEHGCEEGVDPPVLHHAHTRDGEIFHHPTRQFSGLGGVRPRPKYQNVGANKGVDYAVSLGQGEGGSSPPMRDIAATCRCQPVPPSNKLAGRPSGDGERGKSMAAG
jgi:hypothetical protein